MFDGRPPPTRFQCTVLLSLFTGIHTPNSGMTHVWPSAAGRSLLRICSLIRGRGGPWMPLFFAMRSEGTQVSEGQPVDHQGDKDRQQAQLGAKDGERSPSRVF